ncbi:DUF4256 domain-containing protein [Mycoplasmopsis gallopavonis]|uniref:DUF4256 domain-containing protein n=1 Tax=Mycoplasmopsis gallopavonis TaxID=76629 RepID=A0A449B0K8_9BACT|nr:DUF4256 domain-containing protein [Mycoplasmopsis gallopavonis]RIV17016.1 DUF4256 family protein [Mycoplasmopsis gallopavonis]VEU73279.1 Uncharacterised protein [Mycoplasmopsis gallopavonis]
MEKEFLDQLEKRFTLTSQLFGIDENWSLIKQFLLTNTKELEVLKKMEKTGGEINLIKLDNKLYYVDLYKTLPATRASLCYDELARKQRKKFPPISSVEAEVAKLGSSLLNEQMYLEIQKYLDLDTKTSTWLLTENELRNQGGAIFGDKRYSRAFIYHNGADSYYSSRGFRTFVEIKLR